MPRKASNAQDLRIVVSEVCALLPRGTAVTSSVVSRGNVIFSHCPSIYSGGPAVSLFATSGQWVHRSIHSPAPSRGEISLLAEFYGAGRCGADFIFEHSLRAVRGAKYCENPTPRL